MSDSKITVIKKGTITTLEDHKATLIELARSTGVELTFSTDFTCVNANHQGSFICTSCQCTLEENIIDVTNWIADLFYNVGKLQKLLIAMEDDDDICPNWDIRDLQDMETEWLLEEEKDNLFQHPCNIADIYLNDCYIDLKKELTRIHS